MNTESNTPTETPVEKAAQLLQTLEDIQAKHAELNAQTRATKAELYSNYYATMDVNAEKKLKREQHKELMRMRYATKNGLSIHNLRQAGNTVSVLHIRYAYVPGVKVAVPVPSYLRGAFSTNFLPRGGATHVTIITPSGEWMCLTSVCHLDDSFDYKLGVRNALDQLTKWEAEDLLVMPEVKIEGDAALETPVVEVEPEVTNFIGAVLG